LPSLAYWIGIFISFKMAILASFIILIVVGVAIKHLKKSKTNRA